MQHTPAASEDAAQAHEDNAVPPAHDEFPVGTLVAVAVDDEAAAAIVESARDAGAEDAHLLDNTQVLAQDAHRKAERGPLSSLVQTLGALVSDQGPLQDRYLEHARAGHPMVVASAPDEAAANRLWQVMRDHGARDGTWYGPRVVHEMI
jgi:hypothetical protein